MLRSSLVYQLIHGLVKTGLVARLAIAAHVEGAVGFEAKAFQGIGQIADLGITASLGLAVGTNGCHTSNIGTESSELRSRFSSRFRLGSAG